jgi:hypothetical protein
MGAACLAQAERKMLRNTGGPKGVARPAGKPTDPDGQANPLPRHQNSLRRRLCDASYAILENVSEQSGKVWPKPRHTRLADFRLVSLQQSNPGFQLLLHITDYSNPALP